MTITQEAPTPATGTAPTATVKHWINGQETAGATGLTQPIYNPSTGEVSGHVALGDAGTVAEAVAAAQAAQKTWGRMSLAKRTTILFKMRELMLTHDLELGQIISAEHGKTVEDARGEIARGRETMEFVCGINQASKSEFSSDASTGVDVHTLRQPLGVVAGITPFNFPAMVPLWMHPVAIAAGNAFILKPSERDPSASIFVAKLYQEAGLPDGVFNVVQGGKVAVDAILENDGIAAVSFVGSTPIAKYVQQKAIANGKRAQALGGANNHAIVMPDANITFAASQISSGAFGSAGERCMALPVAVVVGDAAEPLIAALKLEAEKLKVGPGNAADTDMGPVITPASRQRVLDFTTEAIDAGARAIVDGRDLVVEGFENGFYVGPTILDNVTTDLRAYCDEVFGPLLVVMRVDTYEQAIELVNSSPFGNGAAIFTSSGEVARAFSVDVEAGMVGINVPIPVPVGYFSFGGWKDSLFGDHHAHGPEGFRFYTKAKVVTTRWPHQATAAAASMSFPGND
ncbi:CoA-acylating methylmalonate-semialdehyde dehydrogenase [Pengzhenrongella frigida]|uniref:methylmalonate-semialdehyde dehydrogenase (CoA acylating) n=1 Tax=Pengzhenrongella frigida TaxID=1259133 RepID=A0A4Q5MXS0_9MICO|nr:CoA-acylating methylmalonate-semialdehyde dehydrogenase [Cellulomonas sp. HLT2-17]RYV50468.1 CoA-acylating methylmalonate-semialdehyde dehydrogenase [Cellulomonas sp. HLT2-17]